MCLMWQGTSSTWICLIWRNKIKNPRFQLNVATTRLRSAHFCTPTLPGPSESSVSSLKLIDHGLSEGLTSGFCFPGGREAVKGRWPWQVAILNKYREVFCGGTLVAPGWVLTAAHCVRKHLFVRLGEHDLVENEGTELEYAVKTAVLHPDYNPDTVDNDVALLKIPSGQDGSSTGFPGKRRSGRSGSTAEPTFPSACLPDHEEELPTGSHCTIVGWGKEKNTHVYGTDVLRHWRPSEAEVSLLAFNTT